jgi:hypothetical protein
MEDAKYRGEIRRIPFYFNDMLPPYFSPTVRSFGESRAKRDGFHTRGHFDSQELFERKP